METVFQDSRGLGVNWVDQSPSVGLVGKHTAVFLFSLTFVCLSPLIQLAGESTIQSVCL